MSLKLAVLTFFLAAALSSSGAAAYVIKSVDSYDFNKQKKLIDGPTSKKVFWLVLRKPIVSLFGFNLPFYGRPTPYILDANSISVSNEYPETLLIDSATNTWLRLGIMYDTILTKNLEARFVNEFRSQTDFENVLSHYYAKAQEQSTINPAYAADALQQHLEIRKEEIKKEKQRLAG